MVSQVTVYFKVIRLQNLESRQLLALKDNSMHFKFAINLLIV